MPKSLQEKILSKVEGQKPHSVWKHRFESGFRVCLVIVLAVISSLILAFFVWDLLEIWDISQSFDVWILVANSLLELILLVVLLTFIIYAIYRQTDLPLVRNRVRLLSAIWILFVLAATGIVLLGAQDRLIDQSFQSTQKQMDNLPLRPERIRRIYINKEKNGVFIGTVEQIQDTQSEFILILVVNPVERREFSLPKAGSEALRPGMKVMIEFNPESKQVYAIKILPRPTRHPIMKPLP